MGQVAANGLHHLVEVQLVAALDAHHAAEFVESLRHSLGESQNEARVAHRIPESGESAGQRLDLGDKVSEGQFDVLWVVNHLELIILPMGLKHRHWRLRLREVAAQNGFPRRRHIVRVFELRNK